MFDEAQTRQRRRRAWMKWVGGFVAILLLIIWLASGRWPLVKFSQTGRYVSVFDGRVGLGDWPPAPGALYVPTPISFTRAPRYAISWRPHFKFNERDWAVLIPLWIPALIAIGFPAFAVYRDFRDPIREFNHCKRCNFNRAGLAHNARCPECGHEPVVPRSNSV